MNQKAFFGVFILLAAAGIAWYGGLFSTISYNAPVSFSDCAVNQDSLDVKKCSGNVMNWLDQSKVNNKNARFYMVLESVSYTGESVDAYKPYLYENGYRKNDEDGTFDYTDVKQNQETIKSLEKGTVCTATIDLAPSDGGSLYYKTGSGTEDYQSYQEDSEDMDSGDQYTSKMMSPVKVKSTDVNIVDGKVLCGFNGYKTLSKGANLPGKLTRYSGDPLDWHKVSMRVDFRMDSDGDGKLNERDSCEGTKGSKPNGCPDKEPSIAELSVPENVTANQTFQTSVQVIDSDTPREGLSIKWSNGDTGGTAQYKFAEAGVKTVKVEVTDGNTRVSKTVEVNVGKPSTVSVLMDSIGLASSNGVILLAFLALVIGGAGAATRL